MIMCYHNCLYLCYTAVSKALRRPLNQLSIECLIVNAPGTLAGERSIVSWKSPCSTGIRLPLTCALSDSIQFFFAGRFSVGPVIHVGSLKSSLSTLTNMAFIIGVGLLHHRRRWRTTDDSLRDEPCFLSHRLVTVDKWRQFSILKVVCQAAWTFLTTTNASKKFLPFYPK